MKILTKTISDIHPNDYNPNEIPEDKFKSLVENIKQFGYLQPILIDKDGIIIDGEHRWKAAQEAGLTEIQCVVYDGPEDVKEYRKLLTLSMNNLRGINNIVKYEEVMKDIADSIDYEKLADLTGFDVNEISDICRPTDKDDKEDYKENIDMFNLRKMCIYGNNNFEMPEIKKQNFTINDLIGFNYVLNTNQYYDKTVHFYLDDYQFERIWNTPDTYIEKLKNYNGCLSPDFSLYLEFPIPIQIYNVYRSRWVGRYLQEQGIKIIPTIQWSEPYSFEFCFLGIEKWSIVSISIVGINRKNKEMEIFNEGYKEMLKQLKPELIICYGDTIKLDGNVQYIKQKQIMEV